MAMSKGSNKDLVEKETTDMFGIFLPYYRPHTRKVKSCKFYSWPSSEQFNETSLNCPWTQLVFVSSSRISEEQ